MKRRQPDVLPEGPQPTHAPSLLLYFALAAFAVALVSAAFRDTPDWPGLLVNLATEIFGAIILLILVDRRLRASELRRIRQFPRRLSVLLSRDLSHLIRYSEVFEGRLLDLQPRPFLAREALDGLDAKHGGGFVLLGEAGSGKTTYLQSLAEQKNRRFIDHPREHPPVVLFPLRNWLPDRDLLEAIREHMSGFYPIRSSTLVRTLRKRGLVAMLDGADEIFMNQSIDLRSALAELRSTYPKLISIIASRSSHPAPTDDLPVERIPKLTDAQIKEFRRLYGKEPK